MTKFTALNSQPKPLCINKIPKTFKSKPKCQEEGKP